MLGNGLLDPALCVHRPMALADLFRDRFGSFDPSLALCEANMRELRCFHHTAAMLFEHPPVMYKRKFSKPIVLHGSNLQRSHFGNNRVNT